MITPAIGTAELYNQLDILLQTDTPVFIHGSPGIGKSYIVNDIAKKNGLEIIDVRPINVGLLFFCEEPEKFFPYSWIEINIYHDDIGDSFSEKVFKGPIHKQLRDALSYIKNSVIQEYVEKVEGQAESNRFYNYPYLAIEEALANAIYHKNYELREPIEVNIRLDRIEILSHAGPMPPLTKDDLKKDRIIARKYLNRRVGDFLKELHLTEGKGTGIPKIRREMKNNGSQNPIFETDEERSYFLAILLGRTGTKIKGPVNGQVDLDSQS